MEKSFLVNLNNCLHLGESIRERLLDAKLIADRLWQEQKYAKAFVCSEAVDFLMKNFNLPTRSEAVRAFRMLHSFNIVRPLHQKTYCDNATLARFSRDDDFFKLENELKLVLRSKEIEERLFTQSNGILTVFHESTSGEPFFAFSAFSILGWLNDARFVATRMEGISLCKRLLENGILKSANCVDERGQFEDDPKQFYRFSPEFVSDLSLVEATAIFAEIEASRSQQKITQRRGSESESKLNRPQASAFYGHAASSSGIISSSASSPQLIGDTPLNPTEILAMFEECKELFAKRTFRVESDPLGYGLVLRGAGPSFVHTIDPTGPAAKAGLKVGHIINAVNGVTVLSMHHKDVAKLILGKQLGTVKLTVLQAPQF